MRARYGPLTIDREPVDAAALRRLADDAAAAVPPMAAGDTLACASDDPLTTLVTVLAARSTGVPVMLGDAPFGGAANAPRVGARLLVRSGKVEVHLNPEPTGTPVPEETAVVFWTSGTSGEPKAVLHHAAAMDYQARATAERLAIAKDDGLLLPLPLTHSYGHSVMLTWLLSGAALHVQNGFRAEPVARALLEDGVTTLDGVPTSYVLLLRMARSDPGLRRALASLRVRGCGGDVLPEPFAERFFQDVGAPLHDGYGLTEAGPNVAIGSPSDHKAGTVGRPLPGTRVRIDGETGEVLVRSPSLMIGYLGAPGDAPSGIDGDGWLRTGDAGAVEPGGHLRILGRRKETIIVHGETFPPETLESALDTCPGVKASGVVGLRTGRPQGDHIIAFVETCNGVAGPDEERRVREAGAAVLPPQFVPRRVLVVPELPRLRSQKMDRRRLRRLAEAIEREPRP